ncbi:MAG: DUF1778 domain-containing protein [Methylocella sp.]
MTIGLAPNGSVYEWMRRPGSWSSARLERRKVTDFWVTALAEVARRTIAEHETLVPSDRDRAIA